ncbi:MAG: tetratricopeptide repeat protein, partial [Thermoguttaceae bacterium]
MILADGCARLGDVPTAREAYRQALAAAANDPAMRMKLAESLLRIGDIRAKRDGEEAVRSLATAYPPARRRLVELLLSRATLPAWREARQMLDSPPNAASDDNRLMLAQGLMRRGGAKELAEADAICRQLLAGGKTPPPAAEVTMAELQQLRGNAQEARQRYRTLAEHMPVSATHLALYIEFLIGHGPAEEAERRLKQLDSLAADDIAAVGLRATWLHRQGRDAEVEPLVERWAARVLPTVDVHKRVQLAEAIGDIYQRVGRYACAERWFRRVMRLAPSHFESLARALAAQGRVDEALTLCEQAGKSDASARYAVHVCRLLVGGGATPEAATRCDAILQRAMKDHPENIDLLAGVASVRILQGRSEEAILLCRRILSLEPENFAALNNLAALLAECSAPERHREARRCVDRVIELYGPYPGLLDTKGTVFLAEQKPAEAVEVLKQAATIANADPRSHFHLAIAYWQLGQVEQARTALAQARKNKLDNQVLTHHER